MKRKSLVLLPGLLSDRMVWQHQINHLSDMVDIVVPDFSKADSPQTMIEAVLDVAPPQFALAGHSMGGWIALELTRQHAQRITQLCLLNTTACADNPEKIAFRHQLIARMQEGEIDSIVDELATLFTYNLATRDQVRGMFKSNINSFTNHQKAMLARQDTLALLSHIQCPTLIIHSRLDEVFTITHSQTLLDNITHAKLAIIDDCGHMVTLEAPQAVTALMRFWLMYL